MTSKRFFIHNNIIKNILTITCLYFTSYNFAIAATVQNKASKFDDILDEVGTNSESGQSSDMAEKIRAQRAALDSTASNTVAKSNTTNSSKCDKDLRVCMQKKCGDDFTKCATDTATTFGDKIDSCRKDTTCTAHEYTLFSQEILEDRNQNVKLSSYNAIINCGNNYNDCIFQECGTFLDKCLSKKQEDAAIAKCESIAKKCIKQDSALSSHTRQVISEYRVDAEKQISVDEQRLYALRDEMRNQCSILGAMFDETSLDCVFSINFFAGDDTKTPKASKKLYAGNTFTCTPEWFGIDITTFKENAYRETRAQTAASAAMLGSGVGTAVGQLTSGAIGRAIDSKKAKDALDNAKNGKNADKEKSDKADKAKDNKDKSDKSDKSAKDTDNTETTNESTETEKVAGDPTTSQYEAQQQWDTIAPTPHKAISLNINPQAGQNNGTEKPDNSTSSTPEHPTSQPQANNQTPESDKAHGRVIDEPCQPRDIGTEADFFGDQISKNVADNLKRIATGKYITKQQDKNERFKCTNKAGKIVTCTCMATKCLTGKLTNGWCQKK